MCYLVYSTALWYRAAKYNDNKNSLIRNRQQIKSAKTIVYELRKINLYIYLHWI